MARYTDFVPDTDYDPTSLPDPTAEYDRIHDILVERGSIRKERVSYEVLGEMLANNVAKIEGAYLVEVS